MRDKVISLRAASVARRRLAADVVLNEPIRTRLIQGTGRATRDSGDRAAIIMLGRDLEFFCTTQLDTMPPRSARRPTSDLSRTNSRRLG